MASWPCGRNLALRSENPEFESRFDQVDAKSLGKVLYFISSPHSGV